MRAGWQPRRRLPSVLVALLVVPLALLPGRPVAGQVSPPYVPGDPCPEPNDTVANACQLGQPNAIGTTVQGLFGSAGDVDVYRFEVLAPGAQAYLTLSDLWHEGSLALYEASRSTLLELSDRHGQVQGQLSAPEAISRWLEPGSYAAAVIPSADGFGSAEAHSYTLRVALGPRPSAPAGAGPAPSSARGYSLTLAIEPGEPGPFSLMTFTATLTPPYTDLFDFEWLIDGQPFGENSAVVQLGRPSSGAHSVVVVARGARPYPDRTMPETPPTLSATGAFSVR
jgi:hypothetical protein